jgi:hypothetical protein
MSNVVGASNSSVAATVPIIAARSSSGARTFGSRMPTTLNHRSSIQIRMGSSRLVMPSRSAATDPSTTAG